MTSLAAVQLRTIFPEFPEDALQTLQSTGDSFYRWLYEAGSHASLGDIETAKKISSKALGNNPGYTVAGEMRRDPVLDPIKRRRWEELLFAAGLRYHDDTGKIIPSVQI